MEVDFFEKRESIPYDIKKSSLKSHGVYIGEGPNALEVVVTSHNNTPTKQQMVRAWNERKGGRANPVILVTIYGNKAGICGPSGDTPPVHRGLEISQVERICEAALEKPNRHIAHRFITDILTQIDEELVGIKNQGLLSTHELKAGVPRRDDWVKATNKSVNLLGKDGRKLINHLGFRIERLPGQVYMLKDGEKETAVALFLDEDEGFDYPQERFTGQSPITYALNKAEEKRLKYVIGNAGKRLRLYSTKPDAGFGSRGRTDTYVEINMDLITEDLGGYLWLLFSAEALREGGSLEQIVESSKDYAADLGGRLRERIYDEVVPNLAEALFEVRELEEPTRKELDKTYRMALILLYRLLFISYAEDERFLPKDDNPRYNSRSLKKKAHEIHELLEEGKQFERNSTSHWNDVNRLFKAIHDGNEEWGLPAYDGTLLSYDEAVSSEGAALAEIELTNDKFGPILAKLLIDKTEDGYQGPVDFRNLGVREFGEIYEGLLESELSVADHNLGLNKDRQYVPVEDENNIEVRKGEVYLHGLSGERKSTGTYYTKTIFVEHLLDYSLNLALDRHIEHLNNMTEREAEEAFFNFRVADIAMGSGHFLVAAVDRIEKKLSSYLAERSLPAIEDELSRLRRAAEEALENRETSMEIEDSQLLRRQIARRCIYGVDLNPLATELARLSLWVHTFVPGLPLTFLDYNLVTGDSLAGIGTLSEIADILDIEQKQLDWFIPGGKDAIKEIKDNIQRLGKMADADAEQVREAIKTRNEIEDELDGVKAAFDILAASRIDNDIDPSIVTQDNVDLKDTKIYKMAQEAIRSADVLHFPVSFPEVFMGTDPGFDVIIGNPPWEKTKVEEHEFWARQQPGLRALSQSKREKEIKTLEQERQDLAKRLEQERAEERIRSKILINGPYPGIGSGDPDLYQAFSWRFWNLLMKNGYLGVVLPREAFLSKGSETFRRHLLENGNISDITFILNNRRWAFTQVHPQTTIGLCSARKSRHIKNKTVPIRGPYLNRERFEEGVKQNPYRFKLTDVLSWTETASLPLLPPVPNSIEAFDCMQQAPAIVNANREDWNVLPYRSGITSSDCMSEDQAIKYDSELWPVYKGESFYIWQPETGEYYGWGDAKKLTSYLLQKKKKSRKWPDNNREIPCYRPVIAFRRVTHRTNRRTIIVSLIPPKVFMRDADPFLMWKKGEEKDEAYLLGILSSIPTDWYARRFVEKHLDYYIFNCIPVPQPGEDSPIRERVVELSARLAAVDKRYSTWAKAIGIEYGPLNEDEKQEKIYELDALVALLYGLSREHVKLIFETFHEGWNYEPRLERVLEYYDEWAEKIDKQKDVNYD